MVPLSLTQPMLSVDRTLAGHIGIKLPPALYPAICIHCDILCYLPHVALPIFSQYAQLDFRGQVHAQGTVSDPRGFGLISSGLTASGSRYHCAGSTTQAFAHTPDPPPSAFPPLFQPGGAGPLHVGVPHICVLQDVVSEQFGSAVLCPF